MNEKYLNYWVETVGCPFVLCISNSFVGTVRLFFCGRLCEAGEGWGVVPLADLLAHNKGTSPLSLPYALTLRGILSLQAPTLLVFLPPAVLLTRRPTFMQSLINTL